MKRSVFPRYAVNRSISVECRGGRFHAELVEVSMRGGDIRAAESVDVGQEMRLVLSDSCVVPARAVSKADGTVGVLFTGMSKIEVARLRSWVVEEAHGHDVVASVERVDLCGASGSRRLNIYAQLDDISGRVFVNTATGEGACTKTIVGPAMETADLHAALHVFRNREREAVGYCVVTASSSPELPGTIAVRLRAALLREYRGANLVMGVLLREVARLRGRHPGKRAFLFAELLDPSLYRLLALHEATLIDDARGDHGDLLRTLTRWAWPDSLEQGDLGQLRGHIGVAVRQGDKADDVWRVDPLVRPFLERNPDYETGGALAALIPLDRHALGRLLFRYATRQASKRVKASASGTIHLKDNAELGAEPFGMLGQRRLFHRIARRLGR
ncbi:MAG: PilZ domain-containing protein [Myxococcales bacterium]|nr:PilZ domain-containing protein [Myxococcales bacterium]